MSNQKSLFLLTGILVVGLSGCFRPDVPLSPFQAGGESVIQQIDMAVYDPTIDDTRYMNQVFIDLGTQTITTVDRSSWDLGFETDGNHLILNSANYMQVAYSDSKTFGEAWTAAEKSQLAFAFDSSTGAMNHSAIGDWWEHPDRVYLIDRGLDNQLRLRGFQQLQFLSADEGQVNIRLAAEDGSNQRELSIQKNPGHNFSFLSLETDQLVEVEPFQQDWDLVFTYYSYRYPDGIPYWLTGALLNRFEVMAALVEDNTLNWENLTLSDTAQVVFSGEIDKIGFDWKEYLFGPPARFVTYSEKIYLLRDTEGYYYKLRFLDFYNDEGLKGFPQLEFTLLP